MGLTFLRHHSVMGLAIACCLGLASCGGDRPPRLTVYPANGTVLLNGQPLANATLLFHSEFRLEGPDGKPAPVPGAYSNAQGEFVVSTYDPGDGLPEGEYRVTVSCDDRSGKLVKDSYPELLPASYQDPTHSGLTVSISGEHNVLPQFNLKR